MTAYIIYGLIAALTGWIFWINRKDLGLSMKAGEGGYSSRKLIAFQMMIPLFIADGVYIYKLALGSIWAEKIFIEWKHTNSLYILFILGFLSFPDLIKLINTLRGNPTKEEGKKEGE